MRALVVFESMFGNTQRVAEALAEGLAAHMSVEVAEVGAGPRDVSAVDLLVVGAPTQAMSLSRPKTRESAEKQAPDGLVSTGRGLREWLAVVVGASPHIAATAFDTRFDKPRWITGSAARAAEKRLGRLGFRVAQPAKSFLVTGTKGPLLDGELSRARSWGEQLGLAMTQTAARS